MDFWHVVSQVVDWLGEKHALSWRGSYGYMTVLYVAGGIGSWVMAKELLTKRNALKSHLTEELESDSLKATCFTEEGGQKVKFSGLLIHAKEAYTVKLTRHDDNASVDSSSDLLHSLDEVEVYLRAHTPFVLADFRR